MPAALSYNLCPSLLIPHPLSKCENSEAIAKKRQLLTLVAFKREPAWWEYSRTLS